MQQLKQFMDRVRGWLRRARGEVPSRGPIPDLHLPLERVLRREVTSQGVRVYSLCASCGAHLAASATLCGRCALRRTASGT